MVLSQISIPEQQGPPCLKSLATLFKVEDRGSIPDIHIVRKSMDLPKNPLPLVGQAPFSPVKALLAEVCPCKDSFIQDQIVSGTQHLSFAACSNGQIIYTKIKLATLITLAKKAGIQIFKVKKSWFFPGYPHSQSQNYGPNIPLSLEGQFFTREQVQKGPLTTE